MGNEANHVTDGLTVIGSLALATLGDADTTFDTIIAYLNTNSIPVRTVGDVLQV